MKLLILALTVLASSFASANEGRKVVCYFTEPFVHVFIDESKATAQVVPVGDPTLNFAITSMTLGETSSAAFGPYTLVYTEDGQGSDGMSDTVYPFSGVLKKSGWQHDLHGGCSASK